MNLSILKSIKFWIAMLVGVIGVLISQGVVLDGSTVEQVIGWVLTLLGAGGAGHTVAKTPNDTI